MYTITIPSNLEGFINTETLIGKTLTEREIYLIDGELEEKDSPICYKCGTKMHVHGSVDVNLNHVPIGSTFSVIRFEKKRYKCPECGRTEMECVIFQADGHRITIPLLNFTLGLLELGYTLKAVARATGLGKNTVKDIDKKRLQERFTELDKDGKRVLKKPEVQAKHLGIDELSFMTEMSLQR